MQDHPLKYLSKKLLIPTALLLICLLSYFNCFNHEFLLDDKTLILPAFIDDLYFLQLLGTHTTAVYYRPLLHLFCAVNHELFGDFVFGYHAVNLLIFYLTGLSFYVLVKKLFNQPLLAFLSALLFICHPINGVLVNYKIAAGYGFLVLAANLSLLTLLKEPLGRNSYLISTAWFLAGLLCHETLAVLPLYLASMLVIARKKTLAESFSATLPHFTVLFLYLYQRAAFTAGSAGLVKSLSNQTSSFFDVTAVWYKLAGWYFTQMIAPTQIVLVKEIAWESHQLLYDNALLLLSVAVIIGLLRHYRNTPSALLGLTWLIISFIPFALASISRPEMGTIIQPHWVTFGSLGFFLWIATVLTSVEKSMKRPVWFLLISMIICSYIFSSLIHNRNWQDQKTYCLFWLRSSPGNFWANFSLGQCYLKEGNFKLAREHFLRSVINGKAGTVVWQNLGYAEYGLGNFHEARKYFMGVLKINPEDPVSLGYLKKINATLADH